MHPAGNSDLQSKQTSAKQAWYQHGHGAAWLPASCWARLSLPSSAPPGTASLLSQDEDGREGKAFPCFLCKLLASGIQRATYLWELVSHTPKGSGEPRSIPFSLKFQSFSREGIWSKGQSTVIYNTLHKAGARLCDLQGHLRAVGILVSNPQIKSMSSQVCSLLFAPETPREWGLSSRAGGNAAPELLLGSDLRNPSPVLCPVSMAKKCRNFPRVTRSPRGYRGMVGLCLKGARDKLLWVSKPPRAGHRWRICRQAAGGPTGPHCFDHPKGCSSRGPSA